MTDGAGEVERLDSRSLRKESELMAKPAISVLTPTYNRAHVLHRAYESLQRQTVRDFEWVVVDDGSTDGTEALLARWQAEADFPITWYRYSNNRGRNAAVNTGKSLVSGDYTLILDSDDALLDDAIETINYWREKADLDATETAYALMFRCVDDHGNLVGKLIERAVDKFPQQVLSTSAREARYRLQITFELITVAKTKVRQGFEFTELTNSEHCPEAVTHNRISSFYDSVYVNRPIRRYYRKDGSMRLSDGPASGIKWPRGNYLRALTVLNDDIDYLRHNPGVFLNAARKITRLGLHIGRSPRRQFRDLDHARARLLWAAGLPGGLVGYFRDRLRGRRAPPADSNISAWGPAAPPENPELHPPPERFRLPSPGNATRHSGASS